MTSVLLIESSGIIKSLKAKDVTLETLYKKCGFRTNDHFGPRHIWNVSVKGETQPVTIGLWAKIVGKANYENKYTFPTPVDKDVFYGTCTLVRLNGNKILNLTPEIWDKVHILLKGGKETTEDNSNDIDGPEGDEAEEIEEDEEEDEEEEDVDLHTKVYLKNGKLVINNKKQLLANEGECEVDDSDEDDEIDDDLDTEEDDDDAEDDGEENGEDDEDDEAEHALTKKIKRSTKIITKRSGVAKKNTNVPTSNKRVNKLPVNILPVDIEELREEPYDYSDLEME
jgi:hypothetical protein